MSVRRRAMPSHRSTATFAQTSRNATVATAAIHRRIRHSGDHTRFCGPYSGTTGAPRPAGKNRPLRSTKAGRCAAISSAAWASVNGSRSRPITVTPTICQSVVPRHCMGDVAKRVHASVRGASTPPKSRGATPTMVYRRASTSTTVPTTDGSAAKWRLQKLCARRSNGTPCSTSSYCENVRPSKAWTPSNGKYVWLTHSTELPDLGALRRPPLHRGSGGTCDYRTLNRDFSAAAVELA